MVMDKKAQFSEEIRILRRQVNDLQKDKEDHGETLEKLKESEKHYRILAENTLDWVFWLAPDDRLVYISPSCRRITGYEADEFLKDPKLLFKIIHQEDRPTFEDHRRFMHKAKSHGEEEFRIVRKDGKTRWISHACHAVYDDAGEYAGILSSNCDSTDRREAEEKLSSLNVPTGRNDDQLKALMGAVTESFFLIDQDGRVLFANETAASRLETDLDALIELSSIFDLLPPEVARRRRQVVSEVKKTGQPLRFEDQRLGRTFLNSIYPVKDEEGDVTQFAVFAMEITERKASEEALIDGQNKLEEAHQMLKQVIEAIPVRIYWKDRRSVYLGCNRLFAKDAGRDRPEQIVGDVDANLSWGEDAEALRRDDQDVISRGKSKIHYEEQLTLAGGKRVTVRSSKVPLTDAGGRVTGVLGTYEDISDQKKAGEILAESEKRYRTLFENNFMPMLLIDPDTAAIKDANPAAAEYYGWSWEELVSKKISDINTLPAADIAQTMKKAKLEQGGQFIFKHRRADGSIRDVEVFSGPLHFSGKMLLYSTISDITDRLQTETVSRRTEKLDSLGILAGGLAHDFNNLMTVVQGHIDVAQLGLPDGHAAKRPLEAAGQAVEKTRDITGRLIVFSRGGDPITKITRVEDFLERSIREALGSSSVAASYELPKGLWPVDVDEGQIRQCLYNLAENAAEAMPDGGALNVSAENVEVTAKDALPLAEGHYVRLVMEDTGRGIAPNNLPRIFDPYFTTKDRGKTKGMGLGLAICYSVLKKHGGYITAESIEGEGAAISMYLPARPEQALRDRLREAKSAGPLRKRLLVMDDNEDIRGLLQMYIEQLGFDVTTVADGQAVLAEYTQALEESRAYRAVIMEISVRQGWGGAVTLMKLKKINPDIKAVAIISEEDDQRLDEYKEAGFQDVLGKPFRLEKIKGILEDILKV